uniref:Uncharacterized protein n=1 Tax=Arundo donax TaxID=35708 RepID=A0A0A9ELV4_ARUDO
MGRHIMHPILSLSLICICNLTQQFVLKHNGQSEYVTVPVLLVNLALINDDEKPSLAGRCEKCEL